MAPFHASLAVLSCVWLTASAHFQDSVALVQSKKKVTCRLCDCLIGSGDVVRCIGTALDKKMLPARIAAEVLLAKVSQEKTHACKDVQALVGATTTTDEAMVVFAPHFEASFDKTKDKFKAMTKLYNQFADAVAGDLKQMGSASIGVKFDSCLRQADSDIDSFQGMIAIAEHVFNMTNTSDMKVTRLHEMLTISQNFIGDFRDRSYVCFKDLAYEVTEIIKEGPKPVFMLSIVRLGLHFDVVAMEAAEEEIKTLHLELECLCKTIGMPVPQFFVFITDAEFTPDELESLPEIDIEDKKARPEEDFPELPEELQKAEAHPKARTKAVTSFDSLMSDLSEVKSMLSKKQNKVLDAAIALSKGLVVESTNSTSETEIED